MAFGITVEGFLRKTLADIKADVEAAQREALGQELNQQADSLLGQLNSVYFNGLAEVWEVMEALYSSLNPDAATGQSLDNVAALTGTLRKDATFSTVLCDVNIDGGYTLLAGSVAFVPGNPNARFLLDADLNNPGGVPALFTDVAFTAEEPGPVVANAGTLTGGPELVTGWNSCTNPLDATLGEEIESDPDLRLRRKREVAGPGGASPDAIRADVSKVEDVVSVSVLENASSVTTPDGIPPHAFETIVLGGDDTEVAQAIFDNRAAGIKAHGSTVVTLKDSENNDVDIGFTRPTPKDVWLEYDIAVDAEYPVLGDDLVKQAVVEAAEQLFGQGDDVIVSKLSAPAFTIQGVRDVIVIRLGFSASPVGTSNLPIILREIAAFDTTRVVVSTIAFVDS